MVSYGFVGVVMKLLRFSEEFKWIGISVARVLWVVARVLLWMLKNDSCSEHKTHTHWSLIMCVRGLINTISDANISKEERVCKEPLWLQAWTQLEPHTHTHGVKVSVHVTLSHHWHAEHVKRERECESVQSTSHTNSFNSEMSLKIMLLVVSTSKKHCCFKMRFNSEQDLIKSWWMRRWSYDFDVRLWSQI